MIGPKEKICDIDGCMEKPIARCMCKKHYARWRRSIEGHLPKAADSSKSKTYIKEVALKWKGDRCLKWPFYTNKNGYAIFYVSRRSRYAHRFICEIKHGKPPSPNSQAWHTCGNKEKGCVNPNHIKWVNLNYAMSFRKKRHEKMGEDHFNSKLSNDAVLDIYRSKNKVPAAVLSGIYNVSTSAIYMIWSGRNYKSVTENLAIRI